MDSRLLLGEQVGSRQGAAAGVVSPAGFHLAQPDAGYRYSLDPFLLASFINPKPRERVLDLGAGVGVIALLLARRFPTVRVFALEIQAELARFAHENARANGLAERCFVVRGDLRLAASFFPPEHFHRVVANPPFRSSVAGRPSPNPSRAQARQEFGSTIDDLARIAASLLRHGGSFDLIHVTERLPELVRTLSLHGLEMKLLRLVSSFPNTAPGLALVSARKGGRPGLTVLPQLAVRRAPGLYTPEIAQALADG